MDLVAQIALFNLGFAPKLKKSTLINDEFNYDNANFNQEGPGHPQKQWASNAEGAKSSATDTREPASFF